MEGVSVWFSSEDGERYRLSPQPPLALEEAVGDDMDVIRLDPDQVYQPILGIGSSFEEASVYHLWRMSPEHRHDVLRDLLDPENGIGWNLMRICFGTSDFTSRPYYSYDDMPAGETDPELDHFSIQKDVDCHIIDVLQEALAINPELRFFASPWSPPGWTKSSDSMCGGRLLPEYYETVARYYRRAIQTYEERGIPIRALTLQNEPLMVHPEYPTCYMPWDEQLAFLKILRQELDAHDIETELWIFDHNFDDALTYPARILDDAEGRAASDGVAFHDYAGQPAAMSALHARHPDQAIYFTEHSTWGARGMDRILQYLRNWARSYNAWVTCLDEDQEPNPGPHMCSPTFVTVSRDDPDSYRYIPEYYLLGQISRFVRRGARRIESDYGAKDWVTNAAFANPDGSMVLVAVNQTDEVQTFSAKAPGGAFASEIPAGVVATYRW